MSEQNDVVLFGAELMFEMMEEFCEEMGYETHKINDEESGIYLLQIRLADLGKIQHSVIAELQFIFLTEEEKFLTANVTATVFDECPPEHETELLRAINLINGSVANGSYFMDGNALYLSTGTTIGFNHPATDCFEVLANDLMLFFGALDCTVDGLSLVARGMCTAVEASEKYFFA